MTQLHDTTRSIKGKHLTKDERGTSENQHKIIRRFIPKGQPISELSERQIQRIQRWMNDYSRKILSYQTSHECFAKTFNQIQSAQSTYCKNLPPPRGR